MIQTSDLWNLYPQVSPDGRAIAYVSTQSGSHELWVANRDGSERRQLTDFGSESRAERAARRCVRRTGRPTAAISSCRAACGTGGRLRRDCFGCTQAITADAAIEVAPLWSSDGRILYGRCATARWNVWVRARCGERPSLIPDAVAAQSLATMYFTRARSERRLRWHGPDRQPALAAECRLATPSELAGCSRRRVRRRRGRPSSGAAPRAARGRRLDSRRGTAELLMAGVFAHA